jgi:hypothetical protein
MAHPTPWVRRGQALLAFVHPPGKERSSYEDQCQYGQTDDEFVTHPVRVILPGGPYLQL